MKTTHLSLTGAAFNIWNAYRSHVSAITLCNTEDKEQNIVYWKNKLFAQVLNYGLPIGLLALIPTILIEYHHQQIYTAVIDVFCYLAVAIVTLSPITSLKFKKIVGSSIFIGFSLVKMGTLGSFTIGGIYLLSFSIFATLLFSKRIAYGSIVLNTCICAALALMISLNLKSNLFPILNHDLANWIVNSLNLIFLNVILVLVLVSVIDGFESSIQESISFYNRLQVEMEHRKQKKQLLEESEIQYRSLFIQNPLPMWIYDTTNKSFMQINNAALTRYGYSKEEFSILSVVDIINGQNEEDLDLISFDNVSSITHTQYAKNKIPFIAQVQLSNILYQGTKARLCIVRDVTTDTEQTEAIKLQNQQLKDIAHLQSHVIRAPLAKIMGLVELLKDEKDLDSNLIKYLNQSTEELDSVIKNIIYHTKRTTNE